MNIKTASIYMETDSQQQITSSLCNTATKLSNAGDRETRNIPTAQTKSQGHFDLKAVQRC